MSPINSIHSYQTNRTDLSDIGLCSLNVREYNFNSIILHVQLGNWEAAAKKIGDELLNT